MVAEEASRIILRRCLYYKLFCAIIAGVEDGQDILMTYGVAGLILVSALKKNNNKIKKYMLISTIICLIYIPLLWGGLLIGNQSYGLPIELTGQETYVNTLFERLIAIPIIPLFTHLFFPVINNVFTY